MQQSYEWHERNMEEMRKDDPASDEMIALRRRLSSGRRRETIDRFSPDYYRPPNPPRTDGEDT